MNHRERELKSREQELLARRNQLIDELKYIDNRLFDIRRSLHEVRHLTDTTPPVSLPKTAPKGYCTTGWASARNARTRKEQIWFLAESTKAKEWADQRKAKKELAKVEIAARDKRVHELTVELAARDLLTQAAE
jgi:hypothetical protein